MIIKMYITINNIKGEKRIDLSYSIQNFDSDKEIAVIRMLSDNVKYEILKLSSVMDPISDVKKTIPRGTYAGRELISMLEGIVKDGRPSNSLLTYYVTSNEDFTCFKPQNSQYKKLKSGEFTSLTLRITDQNNNVITDGPQVTVVLDVRNCKI